MTHSDTYIHALFSADKVYSRSSDGKNNQHAAPVKVVVSFFPVGALVKFPLMKKQLKMLPACETI